MKKKNDPDSENGDSGGESSHIGKEKEPWSLKLFNPFKRKKGK